jgi:tRNA (guanine37-N1)-methyltransferase
MQEKQSDKKSPDEKFLGVKQLEIGLITLFPEMFAALNSSITGRAQEKGLLKLAFWNPRHFAKDKRQKVDDSPYGGGPGMVMMYKPLHDAIHTAKQVLGIKTKVIYLSPQGRRFDQMSAHALLQEKKLIFISGRYEGIDQRIIDHLVDEQWSVGDYVLSGGELATMVMLDAMTRLLPGALGDEQSAQSDSFENGLLDYPHYTRPPVVNGLSVPPVLIQGNHQLIEQWRLKQSLGNTWLQRPDLLEKKQLSENEKTLLTEFINEYQSMRNSS